MESLGYILVDWAEEMVVALAGAGKGRAGELECLFLDWPHTLEEEETIPDLVVVEAAEAIVAVEQVEGPIGQVAEEDTLAAGRNCPPAADIEVLDVDTGIVAAEE